jgi:hypothetical protein
MTSFFRKFFYPRKTSKLLEKRNQTRLELLALEDRVTPAVFTSDPAGLITIQLAQNESFTGLEVSVNNIVTNYVTFKTISTNNVLGAQSTGLSVISSTEIRYTPPNGFSGISILGTTAGTNENVTVGNGGVLLNVNNPNLGTFFSVGGGIDTFSSTGLIQAAAAGSITLSATGDISVAAINGYFAAGDVRVTSTGGNITFNGNVTTGGAFFSTTNPSAGMVTKLAGNVQVEESVVVSGNLEITSSSAKIDNSFLSGIHDLTIQGNIVGSGLNFELKSGEGNISIQGSIGSGGAMGDMVANGDGSFSVSGSVNANSITLGATKSFANFVRFADTVTVSEPQSGNQQGLKITTTGAGNITLEKSVSALNAALVDLESAAGQIDVSAANITTATGRINLISTNGIILAGSITSSGGHIRVENSITGSTTTNGNISTTGNGTITLESAGVMNILGTVSSVHGGIGIQSDRTGGFATVNVKNTLTTTGNGTIYLKAISTGTNSVVVSKGATITSGGQIEIATNGISNTVSLASGSTVTAVGDVLGSGTGTLILSDNIVTSGQINLKNGLSNNPMGVQLAGNVLLKTTGSSKNIVLPAVNGNYALSLEATGTIATDTIGQATPLSSLTVLNSAGTSFQSNFSAASVVLTDSTNTISFSGNTSITTSLTTAAESYGVSFTGSNTLLAGAPVFLNTGNNSFAGTTILSGGATIGGNSTSIVNLAGNMVSNGNLTIGAAGDQGQISIADGTQLNLASTSTTNIFARPISVNGSNPGTFTLLGLGTLTLAANSSTSAAGDTISVTNGKLAVGNLGSSCTVSLTGGTITSAFGTVGSLNSQVGTIFLENELNTGAVNLGAATDFNVAITPEYLGGKIFSSGPVTLGNARLNLASVAGGLNVGYQLGIVNNTGSGAISGIFQGLPEGATLGATDSQGNTVNFSISYKGFDAQTGNDVVLTVTSVVAAQPALVQPMVAGQPVLNKYTAVGADAGGGPLVTITFANGTYSQFFAFSSSFTGGVRVALADINGDLVDEIITGAGPGGGPQVNIYQINAASGQVTLIQSFFAFNDPFFTGGVYVAAGHVDSDQYEDLVIGAGAGGGPRVAVYGGTASGTVNIQQPVNDFFAYSTAFTGGVVVATANRDSSLFIKEVVTAPASNGGYNIKSFNCNGTGNTPTLLENFFAFNDSSSVGGLSLAVGGFDAGFIEDLLVGTTAGQFGVILNDAYSGILIRPFAGFTGAVRAGITQDSMGLNYAAAAAGPGGGPVVAVYSVGANSLTQTDRLFMLNPAFTGGLFMTPEVNQSDFR